MKTTPREIFGLLFLALIYFGCAGSQKTTTEMTANEAIKLFASKSDVVWSGLYLGAMDQNQPVALSLASDGRFYKGVLAFQETGLKLNIEGSVNTDPREVPELVDPSVTKGELLLYSGDGTLTLENKTGRYEVAPNDPAYLKLNEYYNNLFTGTHKCVFSGEEILMYYSAAKAQLGAQLRLRQVKNIKDPNPLIKPLNTHVYQAEDGKGPAAGYSMLVIHPEANGSTLKLITPSEYLQSDYSLFIDTDDMSAQSNLFNTNEIERGNISGTFAADWSNFTGLFTDQRTPFTLIRSQQIGNNALTAHLFYASLSVHTPFIANNEAFNELIKSKVSAFINQHESAVKEFEKTHTDRYQPAHRMKIRSYIYYDVSFLSENLVSVQLAGRSTHTEDLNISINFDLSGRQPFGPEDMFNAGVDYKKIVAPFIKTACESKPYADDQSFETLIASDPFEHYSFTEAGLLVHTDFNGLFGKIYVHIPYQEIRSHLNENGPLKDLL